MGSTTSKARNRLLGGSLIANKQAEQSPNPAPDQHSFFESRDWDRTFEQPGGLLQVDGIDTSRLETDVFAPTTPNPFYCTTSANAREDVQNYRSATVEDAEDEDDSRSSIESNVNVAFDITDEPETMITQEPHPDMDVILESTAMSNSPLTAEWSFDEDGNHDDIYPRLLPNTPWSANHLIASREELEDAFDNEVLPSRTIPMRLPAWPDVPSSPQATNSRRPSCLSRHTPPSWVQTPTAYHTNIIVPGPSSQMRAAENFEQDSLPFDHQAAEFQFWEEDLAKTDAEYANDEASPTWPPPDYDPLSYRFGETFAITNPSLIMKPFVPATHFPGAAKAWKVVGRFPTEDVPMIVALSAAVYEAEADEGKKLDKRKGKQKAVDHDPLVKVADDWDGKFRASQHTILNDIVLRRLNQATESGILTNRARIITSRDSQPPRNLDDIGRDERKRSKAEKLQPRMILRARWKRLVAKRPLLFPSLEHAHHHEKTAMQRVINERITPRLIRWVGDISVGDDPNAGGEIHWRRSSPGDGNFGFVPDPNTFPEPTALPSPKASLPIVLPTARTDEEMKAALEAYLVGEGPVEVTDSDSMGANGIRTSVEEIDQMDGSKEPDPVSGPGPWHRWDYLMSIPENRAMLERNGLDRIWRTWTPSPQPESPEPESRDEPEVSPFRTGEEPASSLEMLRERSPMLALELMEAGHRAFPAVRRPPKRKSEEMDPIPSMGSGQASERNIRHSIDERLAEPEDSSVWEDTEKEFLAAPPSCPNSVFANLLPRLPTPEPEHRGGSLHARTPLPSFRPDTKAGDDDGSSSESDTDEAPAGPPNSPRLRFANLPPRLPSLEEEEAEDDDESESDEERENIYKVDLEARQLEDGLGDLFDVNDDVRTPRYPAPLPRPRTRRRTRRQPPAPVIDDGVQVYRAQRLATSQPNELHARTMSHIIRSRYKRLQHRLSMREEPKRMELLRKWGDESARRYKVWHEMAESRQVDQELAEEFAIRELGLTREEVRELQGSGGNLQGLMDSMDWEFGEQIKAIQATEKVEKASNMVRMAKCENAETAEGQGDVKVKVEATEVAANGEDHKDDDCGASDSRGGVVIDEDDDIEGDEEDGAPLMRVQSYRKDPRGSWWREHG